MDLLKIKKIAERVKSELQPFCSFIEIAGSIRREALYPNDIEIVAVREIKKIRELNDKVNLWKKVKGDALGKYTQRIRKRI